MSTEDVSRIILRSYSGVTVNNIAQGTSNRSLSSAILSKGHSVMTTLQPEDAEQRDSPPKYVTQNIKFSEKPFVYSNQQLSQILIWRIQPLNKRRIQHRENLNKCNSIRELWRSFSYSSNSNEANSLSSQERAIVCCRQYSKKAAIH